MNDGWPRIIAAKLITVAMVNIHDENILMMENTWYVDAVILIHIFINNLTII